MFGEGSGRSGRNQPRAILRVRRDTRRGPTCAGGGIGRRARLRALWAVWPVEVRVLFGAWKSPANRGAFFVLTRHCDRAAAAVRTAVRTLRRRPCRPMRPAASRSAPSWRVLRTHLGSRRTRRRPWLALCMVAVAQSGRRGSSCDPAGVSFGRRFSEILQAIRAAKFPRRPKTRYGLVSEALARPFGGTAGGGAIRAGGVSDGDEDKRDER